MLHPYCIVFRAVHAHVIFWIHDEDADAAISKIRSCMPADWDPEADGPVDRKTGKCSKGNWIEPDMEMCPEQNALYRMVRRKQPHNCTKIGKPGCRKDGIICSGHFPQPIHTEKMPKEDDVERCYRYYCPGQQHRNVGPYIPVSAYHRDPPPTPHPSISFLSDYFFFRS